VNDEWSLVLRPEPRSASMGSVRVANQAGATPKRMPVTSARTERKAEHRERRSRADRQEVGVRESQIEQQLRRAHGDDETRDAARHREQHAFDERLGDDLAPRRADGEAHGRLTTTRDRAREQEVRDVGARDQQHETADAQQDLQARPYSSFMMPTPAPAGTTAIVCFGSMRMTSGIQLEG
jgi:hypothetical protein